MKRRRLAQPGLVAALACCDTGNAIPFGLASGLHNNRVNTAEWVLSGLYAIAALMLCVRLAGWDGPRSSLSLLITAGIWAASASYAAWLPHATVRAHVGFGLIFLGIALAALFAYAREREAERHSVQSA